MSKTLRLSKQEEKDLSKKAIEINKVLISNNIPPIQESELLHVAISLSLKYLKVVNNQIVIDR